MPNPRHAIRATTLALTLATASCGGSGTSQPPLALREDSATSVAAEALISTGVMSSQLGDIIPAVAAGLHSLAPGSVPWLTALATGPQRVDGTVTNPCDVSGTVTVTTAGAMTTITYAHCMDNTSSTLDGTLRSTRQPSSIPDQTSMTVSFDLTGTQGSRNFTESGGFTSVYTTPQSPSDSSESERIGDRLTLSFRGKRDTAAARALARRRPLSRPRPWFRHDGAGTALARVSMGSVRTRQSRT